MRDKSIDILRFIAIVCIVVIHIEPSTSWIREIRSFDVPLMVFLSGVSYSLSQSRIKPYPEFVASRFSRLIVPTWVFLCTYYAIHAVLGSIPDFKSVLKSFLLLTGWYTWIIRVLFLVAITAPFAVRFANRMSRKSRFFTFLIILFLNELLAIFLCKGYNSYDYRVMFVMTIPYVLVFLIGTLITNVPKKTLNIFIGGLLLIFISYSIVNLISHNRYVSLQLYKYPPRFYWITYGLACSLILWRFREGIATFFTKCHLDKFASFIGSHTLWFYFWHILLLELTTNIIGIGSPWLRFVLVFFPASVFVYAQSKLVCSLTRMVSDSHRKKILRVFNG